MEPDFYKGILNCISDGVYFVDPNRRITFWNQGAERISGYSAGEMEGKSCADNLLRHIDDSGSQLCNGMCPLAQTLKDGKPSENDVFLHHKNGHRVPVTVRVSPMRDDKGAIIGAVEIFYETLQRQNLLCELSELRHKAICDHLTGLGNRLAAHEEFARRVYELQRYDIPFGLIFVDVDHFKSVNDTYGHETGDQALVVVSRTLVNSLRADDTVCRWGGEEFLAILPQVNETTFRAVAERMRRFVESSTVPVPDGEIKLTVSIGGAMAVPSDSIESLVARADAMMYQAKDSGRNCWALDCGTGGVICA
ncbi:MAG: GGDEF domain-containing protein [Humidesulfovibrio sp.]|nr:GGDEF domain-containing protein [Humidesulfovibrio sp.]